MTRRPTGLSAEQRAALLARVQGRNGASQSPPRTATGSISAATDFTTLPGYRDLQLQRSVAAALDLDNPFFRLHDGRAGAETRMAGRTLLNFSSYDYLGLNGHPDLAAAAVAAIERYGTSASASRVVAGERPVHRELESALAHLYGAEDCVVMVSGYATNVTAIGHLVGPKDLVVHDALIHNSVVMGAKLAGAERKGFAHNNLADLDALLGQFRGRFERTLIVVEGLYSMDGDCPDLPKLIEIKRRHNCWLMVDDAHALGVLGERGFGIAEHFGVEPTAVDIWMGTLSKSLAGCGGYIAGATPLIEYLKCTAGGFVYSVGMAPPLAAAAVAALDVMRRDTSRVAALQRNGRHFLECARLHGLDTGASIGSAITPVIVGDSLKAVMLSQRLLARGINVLPIIHPAVPERSARLRYFVTATHTSEQIERAVAITAEEMAGLGSNQTAFSLAARQHT
jgi:8-amino-7-oxononanoate synthase